jgi:glycosyltransferase involved in cell wall biosynthesis
MPLNPDAHIPVASVPVSVIISARNERENLRSHVPLFVSQNYPDFEVIVVNDRSFDGTGELLKEMEEQYDRLKVVTVLENDRFSTGKKFALTMGIKAAKNEHLLFTDADCRPASDNWLALMAANFSGSNEIVLGYGPYQKTKGFLNAFVRFETVKTGINYLSAALKGRAYMGVGRNLAYTKSLFFKVKGFASHMHVLSGDDDLFVNQNANRTNTVIELHPGAFTYSDSKTTWSSYFTQKKRHMGAGKLYKRSHRQMLIADAMSGFLFYLLFIIIVCLPFNYETIGVLGLFIIRWITQLIVYRKIFRKLEGGDLLWALPFFDLFYYMYLTIFGLIGSATRTTRWK